MNKNYVDHWSLVHILNGGLYGFLAFTFGFKVAFAVILSLVAAILWELYENFMQDTESEQNSLMDILIAGVGAVPAYFIPRALVDNVSIMFQAVVVVYAMTHICISFWFWWKYHQKMLVVKKTKKKKS